jgi:hypothetical protein
VAARRLLIVLVILLAISTLAAVLAPPPDQQGDGEQRRAPSPKRAGPPAEESRGKLVRASVAADAGAARSVRLEIGDQLSLTVRRRRPSQIEIAGLGLIEDAEPGAPARFDVFADHPGRFEVRVLGTTRTLARILVSRPQAEGPKANSTELAAIG